MSQPPQGYISAPEAARMIGVHQETVRNYVKDEKLEGMREFDPRSRQHRYWIKRESVERFIEETADEPERIEQADQLARRTEEVLERIAVQEAGVNQNLGQFREDVQARLIRVEERQEQVIRSLDRAVGALESLQSSSKQFQDRMLELIEEEREYLRRQREELHHEERRGRGFWARLFGIR